MTTEAGKLEQGNYIFDEGKVLKILNHHNEHGKSHLVFENVETGKVTLSSFAEKHIFELVNAERKTYKFVEFVKDETDETDEYNIYRTFKLIEEDSGGTIYYKESIPTSKGMIEMLSSSDNARNMVSVITLKRDPLHRDEADFNFTKIVKINNFSLEHEYHHTEKHHGHHSSHLHSHKAHPSAPKHY
jgi:translation elongation factor P/translation initiation factor 5A